MDEPPQHTQRDSTGAWLAVGSITLFSAKPIFIKWAYEYGVDATTLMTLRLLISAPFFLLAGAWAIRQRRPSVRDGVLAAGLGLLGAYLSGWLDMAGLMFIPAQLERMLLFTYPIFTVLLGWLLCRTPVTRAIGVCMLLTYSGLALMFGADYALHGDNITVGTLLVLAASFSFALYMILSQPPIHRMGSVAFTAIMMLSATVAICLHHAVVGPMTDQHTSLAAQPLEIWVIAGLLAGLCTVTPAFMGSEAVKRLGPQQVSLMGNAGPIITSLLAVGFLGEVLSLQHALGMALIVIGIAILQRPPSGWRRPKLRPAGSR
ncbi:DMT family transporter [Simiduia agarivorans]|uniref:EamA domain-containing protein n=1 Tax=Simiduia agarivorans (strain DSM 21679 / JCM 13881 / BCRC 17597 / SA1) TaxID=1117647 RepID=K4KKL9_SIMAS|nr:DMT family transporter [Simiduia agarivorans]AFU98749.1 hypothetical protein M5M_07790 [Simiduia agarivorans SA1 = DSM 21679]